MHFAYALELPESPGPVQREFNVAPEASFALSIKNPNKAQRTGAGLGSEEQPDYPPQTQKVFRGRRFEREDPSLLNFEGAEFVLVGARENPQSGYDLDLEPEHENARTADLIKDLRMARARHPLEPLLKGKWS
jgi:hypothetical protein